MTKSKLKTVVLSFVWLAVVCGAVALAITRRAEQGITAYIIVGLATVMLALFGINHLPRKVQKKSSTDLFGKLFLGLLILFAILILSVSLIKGFRTFGIIGNGVLILFLITFIRIFIDYVKDFNKASGNAGENSSANDTKELE